MLVDTSVWVDHLRRGNARLSEELERGEVTIHPFVIGELACGNLRNRNEVISRLADLPNVPVAEDLEVMGFVDAHTLMGRGLGWVDVHLLASAVLAGSSLWTLDRRLAAAAESVGV